MPPWVHRLGFRGRGLRPAGFDDLGLRQALAGRALLFQVAAMAFLAALSLGGTQAVSALARHWRIGAATTLTVQVPNPAATLAGGPETRLARALALLHTTPGVAQVRPLSDQELADLLRPWLGEDASRISLPLPAVIDVRLAEGATVPADLARRLAESVPGSLLENHGPWLRRLSGLAASLQACAVSVLLLVIAVAAAMIVVAVRSGLAARRDAIEVVHGLGALDSDIAGRFARRATWLAACGALAGAVVALPVLAALARLASPIVTTGVAPGFGSGSPLGPPGDAALAPIADIGLLAALPAGFWLLLPGLPAAAALIGWGTTQATVRGWLRQLP